MLQVRAYLTLFKFGLIPGYKVYNVCVRACVRVCVCVSVIYLFEYVFLIKLTCFSYFTMFLMHLMNLHRLRSSDI